MILIVISFIFIFWLSCAACGLFILQTGMEPAPPALEGKNLNHWPTREVPLIHFQGRHLFC